MLLVLGLSTVGVLIFAALVHRSRKAEQAKPAVKAKLDESSEIEPVKKEEAIWWKYIPESMAVTVIAGIVLMLIQFIPTVIAIYRGHVNMVPIIVVNVFLGCTYIGWVVALAWSLSHQPQPDRRIV